MKPVKHALAFVIYNKDKSRFMIVKRPDDDTGPKDVWRLPGGVLKGRHFDINDIVPTNDEVELEITKNLGSGRAKFKKYDLTMTVFEVMITKGSPSQPYDVRKITEATNWRWGVLSDLKESARKRSLCSQVFLKSLGEKW